MDRVFPHMKRRTRCHHILRATPDMLEWRCFIIIVQKDVYFEISHFHYAMEKNFMSTVQDRVVDIIVDQLGVDASEVTPEARFREDLEADSLDLVELMMAFEEEFGGEISDEEAQKVTTVGEVVTLLVEAGAE